MSIRHSAYHLHITRVIFACLAVIAATIVRLPSQNSVAPVTDTAQVLSYATSINVTDLANGTNAARAQNGLQALSLNGKLNLSAQLKANDMIAKNYWAHVAPDGTQPWYWFSQAGYDYTSAGENLAYGFTTSDATMTGWMNSAGHRANILGNYQDMGFGIANAENYQGSQNTVVVAHYGTARTVTPAPVAAAPVTPPAVTPAAKSTSPVPTASAPSPAATAPTTPAESAGADTPAAPVEKSDAASSSETPTVPSQQPADQTPVTVATKPSGVPAWQQLVHGTAPFLVIVSVIMLAIASIGYVATHVSLVKHAALIGEQYVLHHPVIDASVTVGAALIMLLTTVGRIG